MTELGGAHTQRDSSKKRYRIFTYEPYLRILRSGSEPLR